MSQTKKGKAKEGTAKGELPILKPNAAGIDIGATEIHVSVHPDRDPEPCEVETVAMEATGVYWIPLFQILETRGFEVCLVNARYYQNVPGRRTDVAEFP